MTNTVTNANQAKVIVWSKEQCAYCTQAKNLLKQKGFDYEERVIGNGWLKEQLLDAVPNARTVPQVFFDNKLIGGFAELKAYLS